MANEAFRQLRTGRRWTQADVAERVCDQIERATGRRPVTDAIAISRMERGVVTWPHVDTRKALRVVFGVNTDADLGFYSKRTVREATAFLPSAGKVTGDIVASVIELGRWDVERRQFIASSTFALGRLSVPDLDSLIRPTRAAESGRTVRVGRGEVMAIRRMTTVLGDAAAELGGGHARHLAVSYLINDVAPWLHGDYSEATGRDLFAATSQLVHLAGWMAQDEGEQALAHNYYAHSFRLAHEAGDGELAATALRGMAVQAIDLGNGGDAVRLSEACVNEARRLDDPRAVAYYQATLASAAAVAGDRSLATSALAASETAIAHAPMVPGESWASHYSVGRWAHESGMILAQLGDLDAATSQLHHALDIHGLDRRRTRAIVLADLGHVQARQGDVDAALASWSEFLDCAEGIRSVKVTDAKQGMSRQLARLSGIDVVELRQRAAE